MRQAYLIPKEDNLPINVGCSIYQTRIQVPASVTPLTSNFNPSEKLQVHFPENNEVITSDTVEVGVNSRKRAKPSMSTIQADRLQTT